MTWKCPCGCALTLSKEQRDTERMMLKRHGDEPRAVHLNVRGVASSPPEPPEPVEFGRCRNCGAGMALLAYLAESLRLRGAEWPFCDACMRGRQPELFGV